MDVLVLDNEADPVQHEAVAWIAARISGGYDDSQPDQLLDTAVSNPGVPVAFDTDGGGHGAAAVMFPAGE